MKSLAVVAGAALVVMMGFAPVAIGTTITEPFALYFGNGSGSLVNATVITTTPSGSFGNTLTLTEDFQSSTGPGVLSDFTFALIGGPAGSTQYYVTKTVTNDTGIIWHDFLIFMGCDFGFTPCSPSGLGPVNVDYGLIPIPTISVPGALDVTLPYLLHWSGMDVGNGEQVQFAFGIDTFDCGPGPCSASWHIGEKPNTVPEPGTLALSSTSAILLMFSRWWRRRYSSH